MRLWLPEAEAGEETGEATEPIGADGSGETLAS